MARMVLRDISMTQYVASYCEMLDGLMALAAKTALDLACAARAKPIFLTS